jgi:hypothetical protein
MDSPVKTDFPITLNGQEYTLYFSLPAIWAFEDTTGEILLGDPRKQEEIIAEFEKKSVRQRLQRITDMLWAGLITRQPELEPKRKEVASWVHLGNAFEIEAKVNEAFSATLPKKPEGSSPLAETTEAQA